MKISKIIFFLLVVPVSQIWAQGFTLSFSEPIKVAPGNSYGKVRPHIVLAADGTPIVQWGKTDGGVFISRLIDTSFSTPLRVNPNGFPAVVLSWTGPTMACAGDTVFVSYEHESGADYEIYCQRSLNGGISFSDTVRVDTLNQRIARYPSVSTGLGGTPFISYMGMNPDYTSAEYEVAKSTDGGQSFAGGVIVSLDAPGDVCDCCTGDLAVDGNGVYQVYRNNNNNLRDIWASVSDDFGVSFDTAIDMDASNWTLNSCPSSGPGAFVSGDSLVAVWLSAASSPSRIKLGTIHASTLQAGPTRNLDDSGTSSQNFPAISGRMDTLGVVWEDNRTGSTDVFVRFTTNGPANLAGEGINVIPFPTTGNQRYPDIAFRNGVFHIVWQDDYQNGVFYSAGTITEVSANNILAPADSWSIFPNPANEFLNLRCDSRDTENRISIFSIDGINKGQWDAMDFPTALSVAHLPAGYYFIQIENSSGIQIKSFTINR